MSWFTTTTAQQNAARGAAPQTLMGAFRDFQARNAPAPAEAPPAPPTTSGGGFSQEAFMQQIAGKPFNQQTLLDLEPWLESVGSKLTPANSVGERTKILDPNTGQWVRVGFGEGHPVWIPQGEGGGGGGAMGGVDDALLSRFGAPMNPYASQPFGETYTNPETPPWLQGEFKLPEFVSPTAADLYEDPGYKARLLEGEQSRNRLASAQGTVLSGGSAKALARYNQDYASNEFANMYGRRLSTYNANVGSSLAARGQNVGEFQNKVGNVNLQYQNRYGQYLADQARQLNDYLTNYGVSRNLSTDWWNQANALADRGLRAAEGSRPS